VDARSKTSVCGRLISWDCGFDSRQGHGCLSIVNVVCYKVGLCDGPIALLEESYRVCVCVCVCVSECDLITQRGSQGPLGLSRHKNLF